MLLLIKDQALGFNQFLDILHCVLCTSQDHINSAKIVENKLQTQMLLVLLKRSFTIKNHANTVRIFWAFIFTVSTSFWKLQQLHYQITQYVNKADLLAKKNSSSTYVFSRKLNINVTNNKAQSPYNNKTTEKD